MNLEERINSFDQLGEIMRNSVNGYSGTRENEINVLIDRQYNHNTWFTSENVRFAVNGIGNVLTAENLRKWTDLYPILKEDFTPLKAGVIMAGNLPLVGFHDFLSVLISGNNIIAKTSSKDSELIVHFSKILCSINKSFSDKIEFTDKALTNFDVIIATGSNNSSRYFEYYFGKYPNIIRKNRNSIAIIDGDESDDELKRLGTDIFSYFGLGCRNVSKIYLPKGYNLEKLTQNWKGFADIISHSKYANNYDFNKAIYLVNKENFYDTGFILLKEDQGLSSPVSVLYIEFYDTLETVLRQIELLKEKIQCVVNRNYIPFGKAQSPELWDYADGIDTIEFLFKKKLAGIL
jgi:hypothetical protein